MDREQIEQAAEQILGKHFHVSNDYAEPWRDGFIDGAMWMQNQSPWISVNDRLPDYDEQVLVYNPDCGVYFNHRSDNPDVLTGSNEWCIILPHDNITHWMPIPELQTDKAE